MGVDLGFEDYSSLPSRLELPQRPSRKRVEHTEGSSSADISDLLDPLRTKQYDPKTSVTHMRTRLNCEATHASAMGHSGSATHFVQLEGEQEHQQTPVCDTHLGKIIENSVIRGELGISKRRIHPEDIAKHLSYRGIQDREKRTHLESYLYSTGLRGEDALAGRTNEDLGVGGGFGEDHLTLAKARRTPKEQASTLERALQKVQEHGGHPPVDSGPTVDVNGKSMTLGESYAAMASIRRKTEPEKYYMAGVKSPDGSQESFPTLTRNYELNKTGKPNLKGGRKKKLKTETWDTSNSDLPGYTEKEMNDNPNFRKSSEERKAAGIPVEGIKPRGFSKSNNRRIEVVMTQLNTPAPEVDAIEKFAVERERRVTERALENIEANEGAERLRTIEAKKKKQAESRNAAFKTNWGDLPRP